MLQVQIFLQQFVPFDIHSIVDISDIKNIVEDIVTGDDRAVLVAVLPSRPTSGHIEVKKITLVISCIPAGRKVFSNDIDQSRLAGAVAAIENRNRLKRKLF